MRLAVQLQTNASVVRYAPPELELSGSRPLSTDTLADLNGALKALSGKPWKITVTDATGAPTLRESEKAADDAARAAILSTPIIQAAFASFPGAELEAWPGQRSVS